MTSATMILSGAKNRLLPASVPFRFFAAAGVFHILFWLTLMLASDELAEFEGGPGPTLAALHLLTLGVLAMCAIGAAFQLLPVATRAPIAKVWATRLTFWLYTPGVLLLTWGMYGGEVLAMQAGGIMTSAGLAVFAVLTADNLRRAGGLPIVATHGWLAVLALVLFVCLGLLLLFDFTLGFLPDHQALGWAHAIFAVFGFMGLFAFGFSQVLIPMFTLSRTLPDRPGWIELTLSVAALSIGCAGVLAASKAAIVVASVFGIFATGMYLWLMYLAFRDRMRKRLGLSFLLIRLSWVFLVLGLILMLAAAFGDWLPNSTALIGTTLLIGWLLTFLTGILQRILPFLASMHTSGKGGKPALLSDLTADKPLAVHAVCHATALVLVTAGVTTNLAFLITLGAGIGAVGAVAFAGFTGFVLSRL